MSNHSSRFAAAAEFTSRAERRARRPYRNDARDATGNGNRLTEEPPLPEVGEDAEVAKKSKRSIAMNEQFRLYVAEDDQPPMRVHIRSSEKPRRYAQVLIIKEDDGSLSCDLFPSVGQRPMRDMQLEACAKAFARKHLNEAVAAWNKVNGAAEPMSRDKAWRYLEEMRKKVWIAPDASQNGHVYAK